MITRKKFLGMVLATCSASAVTAAGCTSDEAANVGASTADPADPADPADGNGGTGITTAGLGGSVCVVADTDGVDDNGFNQLASDGAQRAAELFGLTAEVLESAADENYGPNIDQFIEQECSLIVAVGVGLSVATAEAARANPDQQFALVDFAYEDPIPNVLSLGFRVAEPAFLAGYLAAGMTQTDVVATFGSINIAPVTDSMDGFANGVEYYNEQQGTDVLLLGWDVDAQDGAFARTLEDRDAGRALAADFAAAGADIIFAVAGDVGLGASAYAAENGNLRIIGMDDDHFISDPDRRSVYLTSVVKGVDESVIAAAEQVIANGQPGGSYVGTLENGGVDLAPFHDQDDDVPDELKTELEELAEEIIVGNVTVD